VGDTIKQQKLLRDALDVTYEISKLLKYSPRRDTVFEKLKSQMAPEFPGFRTLCPTRWTVRASSLESVLSNYEVFLAFWDEAKDIAPDADARTRIAGVQFQMTTFNYLFGTTLGELILKHTDNLSKTLQNPKLTAADAHSVAELTCSTLEQIRSDESFDLFWEKLMLMQEKLDVSLPTLPRKRRAPERFRERSGEAFFHDDPKEYYRAQYLETLDLVLNFVKKRFDQPGYAIYSSLESLLLKAARKENFSIELDTVVQFYGEDFNPSLLKLHLEMLQTSFIRSPSESLTFPDIKQHTQSLSPGMQSSMSEAYTLLRLILVMPATNAVSERSASAPRRVKNYLRSTMSQSRLNNLMALHVHKERCYKLCLRSCVNDFISSNEHREQRIAKFKI
jgi:hypothetical protein